MSAGGAGDRAGRGAGDRRSPPRGGNNPRRTRLQGIAFALILLASAGLYFTASRDSSVCTRLLLGVETAGMLLALWVS
jgi:hypothetical protein